MLAEVFVDAKWLHGVEGVKKGCTRKRAQAKGRCGAKCIQLGVGALGVCPERCKPP
ncbi:hypothetical protein D3C72_2480610 [compost metagenome]